MKIIRDDQLNGLMMIPLFQKYSITRCNVKGCSNKPSTIVTECETDAGDTCDFSLCEKHYLECKEKGRIEFSLEFDNVGVVNE